MPSQLVAPLLVPRHLLAPAWLAIQHHPCSGIAAATETCPIAHHAVMATCPIVRLAQASAAATGTCPLATRAERVIAPECLAVGFALMALALASGFASSQRGWQRRRRARPPDPRDSRICTLAQGIRLCVLARGIPNHAPSAMQALTSRCYAAIISAAIWATRGPSERWAVESLAAECLGGAVESLAAAAQWEEVIRPCLPTDSSPPCAQSQSSPVSVGLRQSSPVRYGESESLMAHYPLSSLSASSSGGHPFLRDDS